MKLAEVRQVDLRTAGPPDTEDGQDFPLVIATMPATARQRAAVVGIIILFTVAAAAIAPFANIQLPQVNAFIPVLQTVVSLADLVTATLLFAQFSLTSQPALLALASGYMFSGSFAFLQTLAFPGAYAPAGLIGDANTAAWMFVLWHTTFPTAVLAYVLSKDVAGTALLPGRSTSTSIIITVVCVLVLIAGLSWIVTAKTDYLPSFYTTDIRLQTRFGNQVNFALWLWVTTALAALVSRRRTILDFWLIATLIAWMPNFLVAALSSSVRFSIGWYAARGFVLIASCMVLTGLLTETTFLYSRLASTLILQRRERTNRLLSIDATTGAMAHELGAPLGAIALNASTALSQLRSNPPELEEMDEILSDIEADSLRAAAIISSIRQLTKKRIARRTLTRVEDIAQLVLRLLHYDLLINNVSVTTDFQDDLPEVHLDSIQLEQALVNLIKNAIDAMSAVLPGARHLRLTTSYDGQSTVLLSVQDSGPGIPVEDQKRIFDPFFSTKPDGTGLGLAISSTVIANQGGNLRLVKSDSDGSIFGIEMPVSRQLSAD